MADRPKRPIRSSEETIAAPEPAAPPPASTTAPDTSAYARYTEVRLLGTGGMGEVYRAEDRILGHTVAIKLPAEGLGEAARARFLAEARLTAGLQHPAIVPVHDIGTWPDGRPYYAMKVVEGRRLDELVGKVHAASRGSSPVAWSIAEGFTLRRLIDALNRVCEAVAYAHGRGVVHRDLKPANLQIGAFGEVLVLDWGLARQTAGGGEDGAPGVPSGTPAYMAPEQAAGDLEVRPTWDVYALGACLYEILTGQRPYQGTIAEVQAAVKAGPPPPLEARMGGLTLDPGLARICGRAMARRPEDRYPEAGAMEAELRAWMDGDQRRIDALRVVAEADVLAPRLEALREEARTLREEAGMLLRGVPPSAEVSQKLPAWSLQDRAEALEREADLLEVGLLQRYRGALTHDAELPLAHERLADHHARRHAEAEARGDGREAAREEVLLRTHDRGRYGPYLRGEGRFTLLTDPPGARARLHRYVERDRRLVPEFVADLGETPIVERALPMGSWLVTLHAEGRAEVRYPIGLARQEAWTGVAPGEDQPRPIWLPDSDELSEDDRYVPAGWFWAGGDPLAPRSLPRQRVWVEPFIMKRFPVTNREYLEFLNTLVAEGREQDALRWVPRERSMLKDQPGQPTYGRDPQGRFVIVPDAEGDVMHPDEPVCSTSLRWAREYAAWRSSREGRPWRLPTEAEREKATRGADGRAYTWGDFFDPTFAQVEASASGAAAPVPVGSHPEDCSVYGIQDLCGNSVDLCNSLYESSYDAIPATRRDVTSGIRESARTRIPIKGGAWSSLAISCRAAARTPLLIDDRLGAAGFRLVRATRGRARSIQKTPSAAASSASVGVGIVDPITGRVVDEYLRPSKSLPDAFRIPMSK